MFTVPDSLVSPLRDANEDPVYHDEQSFRLPCPTQTNCSKDYGPHAVILALQDVPGNESGFETARLVAYINFEKNKTWSQLGLAAGPTDNDLVNRVFLQKNRGDTTYIAWVKNFKGDSTALKVFSKRQADRLQAVALFEEDLTSGEMLLGVRCGERRWCVIAPTSLSAVTLRPTTCRNESGLETCRNRGWADQQQLAKKKSSSPDLELSPSSGTIYPVRGLGNTTDDDFTVWKKVATIRIADADYVKTSDLTFYMGGDKARAEVWLLLENPTEPDPEKKSFKAWIKSFDANGVLRHQPIISIKRKHHAITGLVPGMARWKWSTNDEGIWVRCGVGCCEVEF
jgi:hypothetical protein